MADVEFPIRTYFFDASAIVRLVCREPGHGKVSRIARGTGSSLTTSWILIAEALGVLKRKWQASELSDHDYGAKVFSLLSWVEEGRLRPVDIEIKDGAARLITYPGALLDERQRYPFLDAADAFQFRAIREGYQKYLVGECRPRLVTADAGLSRAAKEEGIEVIEVNED